MATTKLTPRQKMINMLYLVLTAILALNVSSEVLDAFKDVNDGIELSNKTMKIKNDGLYAEFTKQYGIDSLRAKDAYFKATQARLISKNLYTLLDEYKQQMIQEAGGIVQETGKIKRDDDIDVPTRMFVEKNGQTGRELRQKIQDARQQLLALMLDDDREKMECSFAIRIHEPTDGRTWEYARFNHVPVVAAVTEISKFQNDVLAAEGHIMESLYSSVYKESETVDQFAAKIISGSNYILQGDQYKADVMIAGYSTTLKPEVFLGSFTNQVRRDQYNGLVPMTSTNEELPLTNITPIDVRDGLGKLTMPANGTGTKKYTGVIRLPSKNGGYKLFPFEGEYEVAPKLAVASPRKMNVLYIGLDNPVDISVAGVSQNDVVASFEGSGTLIKNSDGSYKALVTTPGNAKIKISARINNTLVPMGEQVFRIKRIPDPLTTIDGNKKGGEIRPAVIQQITGVVARSDDFIYGDIQWKVLSCRVGVRKGIDYYPVDNPGPAFNQKVKDLVKGLKKGDAVFIDEILVKGPDDKTRKIAPLAFNITSQ
ncbi:MAG: gliding motility protein GldM [Chitinophagales bacterium]